MDRTSESVRVRVEQSIRRIESILQRSESDPRPVVLMLCGVAGAGKSTYAKTVARLYPNFERFSIDQIQADRYGLVGIDYPREEYEKNQDDADVIFRTSVEDTLREGIRDVILDRAFFAKEDRDLYRKLVDGRGGRCVLLYLTSPKDVNWQRICTRREVEINADSAHEINQELLDIYFDGFEIPTGEGEIVIDTTK